MEFLFFCGLVGTVFLALLGVGTMVSAWDESRQLRKALELTKAETAWRNAR